MAERSKTCIMTTRGFFDPLNPRAEDVSLEAIAHSLGRITRFAGHTHSPDGPGDPLRVAAHSMRVARIALRLLRPTASERHVLVTTLGALLHDAAEAYTGDRLAPIRSTLEMDQEARVLTSIVASLGLSEGIHEAVLHWILSDECHLADKIACAQEALLFQPGGREWALPSEAKTQGVNRDLVASTLDLFWPRPYEDWLGAVRSVLHLARHAHEVRIDERQCRRAVSLDW